MSKPIDLGKKWDDDIPTIAVSMKDTHYPDLHIGATEDSRLAEMPDEGEATVKYKIISRTHNEHEKKDGKKKHSCSITMEIRSIEPPEPKSKKKDWGARKAISDYFKDK